MSNELITQLVGSLGIAGVLVWFLYHTMTKTLPEKDKAHREEVKEITDKFSNTCDTITERFASTLKDERVYREQEISSLKTWIKAEARCRYNSEHKIKTDP